MMLQASAPDAKRAASAGNQTLVAILSGGATFDFNTAKPPFNDVRLRRAVALAFNWDEYNAAAEGGLGVPVVTMFIKGSPFYDPTLVLPTNNPQQAQQLFDQVASDSGGNATVITMTGTTTSAPRLQYLQGKLQ
jgi:peptide/nickel transport system substrate-binding protein